jgi:hypothetical protein
VIQDQQSETAPQAKVIQPEADASKIMSRDKGAFGLIVGGIVAMAAVFFIFGGGELGGKKTVDGDQDLPPIATTDR